MVELLLTHDKLDARCASGTGVEHSGHCRETASTETMQTIEKIEKTVAGTPVAILVSSVGCASESQCRVSVIQK